MALRIKNLNDVVDWGLCTGCGACSYACQKGSVALINIPSVGVRPKLSQSCAGCDSCLSFCPGYNLDASLASGSTSIASEYDHQFGPVLEVFEGYAADPEIRFSGSSGGILSALALYCLERESMKFILHSGMSGDQPLMNETVQSVNRAELLARTGSRYAPASPCDGLATIESSDGPCVFIGKPCDTAAVMMLRRERAQLDSNLGLVLTFFCAGTPAAEGTYDLIRSLGIDPNAATSVRYRGQGWPGRFRVTVAGSATEQSLTYAESWDRLTGYRPLRCNLCPDGLGRVADISCGDAWHRANDSTDPGRSLVLVRTKRGQEILHRAVAAGYVTLTPTDPSAVLAAQTSLLQRRRELFGRLLALRLLLIPTPQFRNFSLLRSWSRLPFARKAQTIIGTLRRALVRGWWRRRPAFTTE
jgi:coenzyme F420 hydrogenase subunit beta